MDIMIEIEIIIYFQASGWANNFDYYYDVKVIKNFYFQTTKSGEKTVLTQDIYIDPLGKTFKDFLYNKSYVMDDFLRSRNLEPDENGKPWYKISGGSRLRGGRGW